MRRSLLLVVAVGLVACGSDKLNPAFAGLWNGAATLTMGTFSSTDDNVQVTIILPSESTLTIAPVCPENTGSITASGNGDSASWAGTVACQPVAIASCAAVTVTLTSGTGTLSSDGKTLTAKASGTAAGCSQSQPFAWQFVGTK
ncbi:MAG TPA: hypothetical protein VLT82_06530 [Myxococcaceae bacterium]|nr:hypothetical protein [Myxococcaceae bacterium]